MSQSRDSLISLSDTLYYYCTSRCVQRAFLRSEGKYSGQSFEHRCQRIIEKIRFLTDVFPILNIVFQAGADPDNITYQSYGAPLLESSLHETFGITQDDGKRKRKRKRKALENNVGDYVAKPLNILNPLTWFKDGHGTENYGTSQKKKEADKK